jgi:hypothetical protein
MAHDAIGDRPEEELPDGAHTLAADDDQIDVARFDGTDDLGGRIADGGDRFGLHAGLGQDGERLVELSPVYVRVTRRVCVRGRRARAATKRGASESCARRTASLLRSARPAKPSASSSTCRPSLDSWSGFITRFSFRVQASASMVEAETLATDDEEPLALPAGTRSLLQAIAEARPTPR